jgi:hypothetical protein
VHGWVCGHCSHAGIGGVKPEPIGTGEMATGTGPATAGAVPEPFCEVVAAGTAQAASSARARLSRKLASLEMTVSALQDSIRRSGVVPVSGSVPSVGMGWMIVDNGMGPEWPQCGCLSTVRLAPHHVVHFAPRCAGAVVNHV